MPRKMGFKCLLHGDGMVFVQTRIRRNFLLVGQFVVIYNKLSVNILEA